MRGSGFDWLQDFSQRPENRSALLVRLFYLRFKKQVNVVRHYACDVQFVLSMFARVKSAFEH